MLMSMQISFWLCIPVQWHRVLELWRSVKAGGVYTTHTQKIMSAVHKDLLVAYFQLLRFEKVTEV